MASSILIFGMFLLVIETIFSRIYKNTQIINPTPIRLGSESQPNKSIGNTIPNLDKYKTQISRGESNNKCVICYSGTESGTIPDVELKCCKQPVHGSHLKSWVKIKKQCPYCGVKTFKAIMMTN